MTTSGRPGLSIAAVERDTGLGKDTLRVWERRYGFPQPHRNERGERLYPPDQVDKLRLVKRLLDHGHRPGKLLGADAAELSRLLRAGAPAFRDVCAAQPMLALLDVERAEELRSTLGKSLARHGLQRFVSDVLAPLDETVEEAWWRGDIGVCQEHLYAELAQNLLRTAIAAIPAGTRPRVLLTTLPGEGHGLGLLMTQALLASEGAYCLSLGPQTPATDLWAAARTGRVDVVALSFSDAHPLRRTQEDLAEVRAGLDAEVELWALGRSLAAWRRPPPGTRLIGDAGGVLEALRAWRVREQVPEGGR